MKAEQEADIKEKKEHIQSFEEDIAGKQDNIEHLERYFDFTLFIGLQL